MTDKQIIIDGVDVSGCEYYDKNKPSLTCTCEEYPCSECYNCYYKQLARKTAECEKYKQALDEIEKYLDVQQQFFDGEDYHNLLDIINKTKE